MINSRQRHLPILLAVFTVTLATGLAIARVNQDLWLAEQKKHLGEVVFTQSSIIERTLTRSLSATYILESLLRRNNGALENFAAIAGDIIQTLGGITNLQLAPDGVVSSIHPLTGHEAALGHDILRDDRRRDEARLAVESGQLTLAGPFELIQGGVAVIGRNPVFLPDASGRDRFWGFTSALINLDDLLAATDLDQLAARGYRHCLFRDDPASGVRQAISGCNSPMQGGYEYEIRIPNGTWTLAINPEQVESGLMARSIQPLLAVLFSLIMTVVCHYFLRYPQRLEREVEEKTRELNQLAFYDSLTGLCNRRLFQDLLDRGVRQLDRSGRILGLLYLDIDHFKDINDTLGHEAGDHLLRVVARRLQSCLRRTDSAARVGGDEFCVLLPDLGNTEEGAGIAGKLRDAIRKPVQLGDREFVISTSIGVTFAPNDCNSPEELMQNADLAMYAAKDQGRNRIHLFDARLHELASYRLQMENELRLALENEEFIMHYQPVFDFSTRRIMTLEALLRWRHPLRGVLLPEEFLRIAEANGMLLQLGTWCLREICTRIKTLHARGIRDVRIALNLSRRQFNNPDLVNEICSILDEYGLDGSSLELEMTETTLMENYEKSTDLLQRLKSLNISIAVDDFGTGYSSLHELGNLPVDALKIDRSFIDANRHKEDSRILTEIIISIAHKLGLTVTAEGIEESDQVDFLLACGCDAGQGYWFGGIQPAERLQEMFAGQAAPITDELVS